MEWLGWKTERLHIANRLFHIFIRRLGPGAIAKIQRTKGSLPWEAVNKILKDNKVVLTRFEPWECDFAEIKKAGFHQDKSPLRATKLLLVDISGSETEILNSFDRARSWIKKIGPKTAKINDHELFYKIWRKATRIKNIWCSSEKDYQALVRGFGDKAFCITIDDNCGALILMHKNVAYYFYAAALPEAKENNLPYAVTWEAMKEAKKRGCKTWDWEGIYDPRWPNKAWRGFSQFKKTFGGEVIDLPGSYSRTSWKNIF